MIDNLFKRLSLALVGLSAFAFCFLTLPFSFAENNDTIVDDVIITVPAACSIEDSTGGAGKTYNVSMMPGQYNPNIGSTTIVATCNDASGFALYAIGYGNEEYGNTDLITNLANPGASGTNTGNIVTGTAQNGNTSNWAMKLSTPTNSNPNPTYPIVIQNGFTNFSAVPSTYTLVAKRTSNTDVGVGAEGARLNTHYAVYVSPTQVAATYTGKVRYTLVHPNDAPAPVPVSKNLYYAITGSANNYTLTISDSDITAGAVASGPVAVGGYSTASSIPWYSYRTGIKSVEVDDTVAPTSTAYWFSGLDNCDSWDLSGLRTDHVTSMYSMFSGAGRNATTFTLDLSDWNTASVTSMTNMFSYAGYSATTWSVTIPKTNNGTATGPISNTASRLYGSTTSKYAAPPSGRSFTLAN